jgi:hypothetical protein
MRTKTTDRRWAINNDLKARIEIRMRERSMNKTELGDLCYILASRIGEWLKGRVTLSDEEFTRLMDVLNLVE